MLFTNWGRAGKFSLLNASSKPLNYFTNLVCLLFVTWFLVGCGGAPTKPDAKKDQQAKVVSEAAASAKGEDLPPLVLIPNPYLQNSVSVSAQAKQEFARAQAAMQAKKYKQAIGLWTLMTETYPKLSGPYVNLGIANWRMGDLQEAENALQFAIETNPNNMDAYTQLAVLYREQGKFNDAEKLYLQALDVWPHHRDSVINLGMLYDLYMGKLEAALQQYRFSQRLLEKPDRKIKGWIVDLERRIASTN